MTEKRPTEGIKLPYLNAYGVISKTLDKIIQAATPDRFTQDFLATKLAVKGGTAKSVIPFLKRTGFLSTDGTPTELYNQFRSESLRGIAAARAIKHGFATLYEMNEYAHDTNDTELKSLIVQATGLANDSGTVKAIIGSFKALKTYAKFDLEEITDKEEEKEAKEVKDKGIPKVSKSSDLDLRLGYTINLNLPATSDIAVYDAIFKSLKEHLINQ